MIIRKKYFLCIFILVPLLVIPAENLRAVEFDELAMPPEGAHKGQVIVAGDVSLGAVKGHIIDAEKSFLQYSRYTFWNSGTTKLIDVNHLINRFGVLCEYMPVDHLGLRVRANRTSIVQRTLFGKDYENWSRMIYNDYSFNFGPTLHLTSRTWWDIALTVAGGYSLGEYIATPIAARLIPFYGGARKKKTDHYSGSADLGLYLYFTGGFFLAPGFEWTMNFMTFHDPFYLFNNQNYMWFFGNNTQSRVHAFAFHLVVGYAISN